MAEIEMKVEISFAPRHPIIYWPVRWFFTLLYLLSVIDFKSAADCLTKYAYKAVIGEPRDRDN